MVTIFVLSVSVMLQFSSAILALRLIKLSGRRSAWVLIAAALLFMGIRRSITLFSFFTTDTPVPPDLITEIVALLISLLMFFGVVRIASIFTSVKQSKIALKVSQQDYRSLIENMNEGLLQVDNDNVILFANDRLCEMVECAKEYIIGKKAHEVLFTDVSQNLMKEKMELRLQGISDNYEIQFRKKSGKKIWLLIRGAPTYDSDGVVDGSVGIMTDITDHKETQEELEKLSIAIEQTADHVMITNKEGIIEYVNPAFENLTGFKKNEVIGKTPRVLKSGIHGNDIYYNLWDTILAGGVFRSEMTNKKKNGEFYYEEKTITPLKDNKGNITHFLSTGKDISEKKLAEDALRVSEQHFRSIFEKGPLGISVTDSNFNILRVNKKYCSLLGYSQEELLNLNLTDITHVEDRPINEDIARKLFDGEIDTYIFEKRYVKKNREVLWVNVTTSIIRDEDNKPIYALGIVEDITERRRTNLEIENHTRQNSLLVELGQWALANSDLSMLMNKVLELIRNTLEVDYCKILELQPDSEFLLLIAGLGWKKGFVGNATVESGKDSQAGYTLITKGPVIVKNLQEEKRFTGPPLLTDHNIVSGMSVSITGTEQPFGVLGVHTKKQRIFSKNEINFFQSVANILGSAIERIRTELSLKTSEQRLEKAQEIAHLGCWDWDIETNDLYWSDEIYLIFGLKPKSFGATYEAFLETIHIEDKGIVVKAVNESLHNNKPYNIDHRIVLRDGTEKTVNEQAEVIFNDKGEAIRMIGTVLDITERKHAENALRNALTEVEQLRSRLQAENIYLQEEIKLEHNFDEIISRSKTLKQVLRKVEQVSTTTASVLILGESGTGKELIARAIHDLSERKNHPLVKVNCAVLPANLIESELFGHEKGAFTGAVSRKTGRFELADGGTIFLDEAGEIPLELQAKLLRILQSGEYERLGNPNTMKVDVRIIAATNRDLYAEVMNGGFRKDLFYRLNVFPILIPPLRDHKEDIPLLVNHFVLRFGKEYGKKVKTVSQELMQEFKNYHWHGNVRELKNVIERSVIISQGSQLEMVETTLGHEHAPELKILFLDDHEKKHIVEVLNRTKWRVSGEHGAAVLLGLKPTTLEARMKKLEIKRAYK